MQFFGDRCGIAPERRPSSVFRLLPGTPEFLEVQVPREGNCDYGPRSQFLHMLIDGVRRWYIPVAHVKAQSGPVDLGTEVRVDNERLKLDPNNNADPRTA